MKIQQQNSYNPNMKALYFTKTVPMCSKTANYVDQKITKIGVKYVEDKSAKLTPVMKEAFEENRFIRNLAEKFDVFVQYLGERFSYGSFISSAFIHVVSQNDDLILSERYNFSANDAYTPEGARYRLLDKIETKQPADKQTYKLGK